MGYGEDRTEIELAEALEENATLRDGIAALQNLVRIGLMSRDRMADELAKLRADVDRLHENYAELLGRNETLTCEVVDLRAALDDAHASAEKIKAHLSAGHKVWAEGELSILLHGIEDACEITERKVTPEGNDAMLGYPDEWHGEPSERKVTP
jgi:chromosome segregation ATPase